MIDFYLIASFQSVMNWAHIQKTRTPLVALLPSSEDFARKMHNNAVSELGSHKHYRILQYANFKQLAIFINRK